MHTASEDGPVGDKLTVFYEIRSLVDGYKPECPYSTDANVIKMIQRMLELPECED